MKKDEYDVIIIGAGIGGLVCGCYLSKAGMKVLVVEKNDRPGGYCTSFRRGSFLFDSTVHAFANYGENEELKKISDDLTLEKKIRVVRADISDIVVTPNQKIIFWTNTEKLVEQLMEQFPLQSKQLKIFFNCILQLNLRELYAKFRNKSFEAALKDIFSDFKLRAVLSIFLGNIGTPPSMASAFSTMVFYKNFILSGGYYPLGGMQRFSDSLLETYKFYGGDVVFSALVKRIIIGSEKAEGVVLSSGKEISSKRYIVTNADVIHTLSKLIKDNSLAKNIARSARKLKTSSSAFLVYLALKNNFYMKVNNCLGIWSMPEDYDVDKVFRAPIFDKGYSKDFVFCSLPTSLDNSLAPGGKHILRLITNVSYKTEKYWAAEKDRIADHLIAKARSVIGFKNSDILFQEAASPATLYRYTFNRRASMCGWLNSNYQIENPPVVPRRFYFKNLLFVGHWATERFGSGGIAMVALSGKKAAEKMLRGSGRAVKHG